MERGFILIAALVLYASPAVQGTNHLMFSNNTQVNITRTGCGSNKLCLSAPDSCDPTGTGPCLFGSAAAVLPVLPNGTTLSFQLQGESAGYVALGLSLSPSEAATMLFVCASNGTSFFFFTRATNNSNANATLIPIERNTTNIRGAVNGTRIGCEFDVPNVSTSTTLRTALTVTLLLGTGTFIGGELGPFNITVRRGPLTFGNVTLINGTTASPTGGAGAVQPHAVLLLLSVLALSAALSGRS
ncbi:putative ferric-chelate reductase 1 [Gasterosteus aculeatus]